MDPDVEMSEIVGSIDVASVSPSVVSNTLLFLIDTLGMTYDLVTAVATADAAGENMSVFKSLASHSVGEFLPESLTSLFPDIDFSEKNLMINQLSDSFVMFLPDMPHLVKNIVTALEKSSKKNSKRNLRYGNDPINLNAIYAMWVATGGLTFQQSHTKLSMAHFFKDAYSRMRVNLAVQVLSQSVVQMIKKGVADENIEVPLGKHRYCRLIELAENVDKLVDICNGRSKNSTGRDVFTPDNAETKQIELLAILGWFSEWKKVHSNRVSKDFDTEFHFFANETWRNIQWLILGHVFLIQFWVKGKGFSFNPRVANTDCIEHHFGNGRQMTAGSHNSLTAMQWNYADSKGGRLKEARRALKGNNAMAPTAFARKQKF